MNSTVNISETHREIEGGREDKLRKKEAYFKEVREREVYIKWMLRAQQIQKETGKWKQEENKIIKAIKENKEWWRNQMEKDCKL